MSFGCSYLFYMLHKPLHPCAIPDLICFNVLENWSFFKFYMLEIRTFEISLFLVAASPVWSYAADEHRIIPQHGVVAAELQGFDFCRFGLYCLLPAISEAGDPRRAPRARSRRRHPPSSSQHPPGVVHPSAILKQFCHTEQRAEHCTRWTGDSQQHT